jgi:membrane protease YdiL (CAAX protease family)
MRQPVNLTDLSSGAIEAPPSKQPHQATTPGQDLAVAVGRRREFSLHDGLQIETFVDYAQRPLPVALFYLAALTLAEVTSVLFLPTVGATLHILILFVLLLHAAFTWDKAIHRFLLVLTLVPLIRVISLSLPLADFSLSYWFLITSVPLFAAAYVIMRQLDFSWRDLGLGWRSLPLQLLIGSTGVLFGMAEYYILKPDPLVENLSWQQVWLPAAVLLLSTGFLEEYVFRFLMQRTSVERLGHKLGIVYVALFFAVLHIGYRSVVDFLFVLFVGLFFGIVAWRTRSIVGVTISHGLTNIMLFLIVPYA